MSAFFRAAVRGCAVLLACWLALSGSAARPIRAADDTTTSHSYTYGQQATFSLNLPETTQVADAQLVVKINGTETQVHTVPITDRQATWEQDLNEKPFPPYATIEYWWEYKDPDGASHTSGRTAFRYEDNRYIWNSLKGASVTVHWVSGTAELMTAALDTAEAALTQARARFEVSPESPVNLYVYPSLPDLQSALRLSGQTWVEGMAYPELGVILVAVSPNDEAIVTIRRTIPHELAHRVLYEFTGEAGYVAQPRWLMEGIASYFEASPDPAYALSLEEAHQTGQLLSLETLCYAFPGTASGQLLAYAESQSIVTYIEQEHGWMALRSLARAYADGLSCNAGAEKALGKDLTRLEQDWRVWLEEGNSPSDSQPKWMTTGKVLLRDLSPWFILLGVLLIPTLVLALSPKLSRR